MNAPIPVSLQKKSTRKRNTKLLGVLTLVGSATMSQFALHAADKPAAPSAEAKPPVSASGVIKGKITFDGILPKPQKVDMSKEPNCARRYDTPPSSESVVTGSNNALANVVVYISVGAPDEAPTGHVVLNQRACRYAPHVLAVQAKQEIWVKNEDEVNHTVHLMSHKTEEWNRLQPAKAPEFTIVYDKPEFIPVKCELHPWMRGVVAVLKNSHFAVTNDSGSFKLPDLPPGRYTVTAWHEVYGTQSQQIVVGGDETKNVDFVFKPKSE